MAWRETCATIPRHLTPRDGTCPEAIRLRLSYASRSTSSHGPVHLLDHKYRRHLIATASLPPAPSRTPRVSAASIMFNWCASLSVTLGFSVRPRTQISPGSRAASEAFALSFDRFGNLRYSDPGLSIGHGLPLQSLLVNSEFDGVSRRLGSQVVCNGRTGRSKCKLRLFLGL